MKFNKDLQIQIMAEVFATHREPFIILEVYTNEYKYKCIHCLAYTCHTDTDKAENRYRLVYCSRRHEILLAEYIKKSELFDNLMKEDHQQYLQIPGQENYEKEIANLVLNNDIELLPSKKHFTQNTPDGKYIFPLNTDPKTFLENTQTLLVAHMGDMLGENGVYNNFMLKGEKRDDNN